MEEHMTIGHIRMTAFDQLLRQHDHLRHVIRGPGFDPGRQRIERGHVLAVGGGKAFGQGADRFASGLCRGIDLVVDVGDVAGVHDLRVMPGEQPVEHVEHHHRPGIADMDEVVDGRAAHVHRDALRIVRHEDFLLSA